MTKEVSNTNCMKSIIGVVVGEKADISDELAVGEDGKVMVARFGEYVIGYYVGNGMMEPCIPYRNEGKWVYLGNFDWVFYNDKFTPTDRYKTVKCIWRLPCHEMSVDELIDELKEFVGVENCEYSDGCIWETRYYTGEIPKP